MPRGAGQLERVGTPVGVSDKAAQTIASPRPSGSVGRVGPHRREHQLEPLLRGETTSAQAALLEPACPAGQRDDRRASFRSS